MEVGKSIKNVVGAKIDTEGYAFEARAEKILFAHGSWCFPAMCIGDR